MKKIIWTGEEIIYEGKLILTSSSLDRFLESLEIEKNTEYEVSTEEMENSEEITIGESNYNLFLCLYSDYSEKVGNACRSSMKNIFGDNITSIYYRKA